MTTTKFEDRKAIKQKNFNRGWCIKLCKEGKGFSIRLAQFNGEISSKFTFDEKKANSIFEDVCKIIKK